MNVVLKHLTHLNGCKLNIRAPRPLGVRFHHRLDSLDVCLQRISSTVDSVLPHHGRSFVQLATFDSSDTWEAKHLSLPIAGSSSSSPLLTAHDMATCSGVIWKCSRVGKQNLRCRLHSSNAVYPAEIDANFRALRRYHLRTYYLSVLHSVQGHTLEHPVVPSPWSREAYSMLDTRERSRRCCRYKESELLANLASEWAYLVRFGPVFCMLFCRRWKTNSSKQIVKPSVRMRQSFFASIRSWSRRYESTTLA